MLKIIKTFMSAFQAKSKTSEERSEGAVNIPEELDHIVDQCDYMVEEYCDMAKESGYILEDYGFIAQ